MAINLLIVDDSAVMRAMILKIIRMSDLSIGETHEAANGREGLDALDQHWIDLVILDINMPVMGGEEMIDHMLGNPETKDIPVVVVSTEGSETRIERITKKGAEFIHKPFTPEIISDAVRNIIEKGADHAGST